MSQASNSKLQQLKSQARQEGYPIITDPVRDYLENLIKSVKNPKLLEIGTAIGYSAIAFSLFGARVSTIERNFDSYQKALKNIKDFGLDIKVYHADALDEALKIDEMFDIIFIDGAKSKYIEYFNRYQAVLKPNGVVVCDNLDFHHLNPQEVSRNTKKLLEKLAKFKTFLIDHPDFDTTFLPIGDGLSVSRRKMSR